MYAHHLINSGNNGVLIQIFELTKDKLENMLGSPISNALMLKLEDANDFESFVDFKLLKLTAVAKSGSLKP